MCLREKKRHNPHLFIGTVLAENDRPKRDFEFQKYAA